MTPIFVHRIRQRLKKNFVNLETKNDSTCKNIFFYFFVKKKTFLTKFLPVHRSY